MTARRTLALIAAPLAALPAAAQLVVQPKTANERAAAGWTFAVTPYVWLPSVDGTVNVDPSAGGGGAAAGDFKREAALMVAGEARKGPWAIVGDVVFLDLSRDTTSVEGLVAQAAVSRALGPSFAVLGGVRYFSLEASVDTPSGNRSREEELVDVIVGVRGRAGLGDGPWFFQYHVDAGTGDSKLTWQALAGVGYSFKWGEALLAYRHLSYDQEGDKPIQSLEFSGPALGARFTF